MRKLNAGETASKDELWERFTACMNAIYEEERREVYTDNEIIMWSSLELQMLSPSQARMMVNKALDKGYLVKRGDYIRPTERMFDFESGRFFNPENPNAYMNNRTGIVCPWCGDDQFSYRDDNVEWDPHNPMKGQIVTFCHCFTAGCRGEKEGWETRTPFTLDHPEGSRDRKSAKRSGYSPLLNLRGKR